MTTSHLLVAVASAALDQPSPTPELKAALNAWLIATESDLATRDPIRPLSEREMIVAQMVADGRATAAEIADALGIKQSTVEKRIESISFKLPNPDGLKPMQLIARWLSKAA